ncbi:MAG TPA: N-acetylmuramoyl-L-alanine amidase [Rhabdochlamydiaceae bacterium]|nr:N-acetylmuramoyl-L-alanine amidase [Rhabdochlamydiaceae bacterium]
MNLLSFLLLFCSLLFSKDKVFDTQPIFPLPTKKAVVSIPKKSKPTVILDPGHGGSDEGAKIKTLLEKKLTLRAALLVKKELELLGYNVLLTRLRDIYTPLSKRVDLANERKPSLFVSIHFNSSKIPTAKGIEIFYYQSKQKDKDRAVSSKNLATSILDHLVTQTAATSRGVKQGNFHVIRETEMPAVLVEGGFLTNMQERNLIASTAYLEKLSKGIAKGIDSYVKQK